MFNAIGYKGIQNWAIDDIQALTEDDAFALALDTTVIKGHDIFFVDFGGYFGFSALVFLNGGHIYYANDYELHHNGRERSWLRDWYIKTMTEKLFTESELITPSADYVEQEKKEYYLRNYYIMQFPYVSMFHICHNEHEETLYKNRISGMIANPISFCYMDPVYKDFIKHQADLFTAMQDAKNGAVNDFEYQKNAFLYEMYNHEYGINWQADFDVISCFGRVSDRRSLSDLSGMFKDAGFSELQKNAYLAARKQYFNETRENY